MPAPSRFMGSPVAFGGYIAMTSEDGDTFMLKAGPKHEIVRTNSVDEPVHLITGARERPHLHPRREASLRYRGSDLTRLTGVRDLTRAPPVAFTADASISEDRPDPKLNPAR